MALYCYKCDVCGRVDERFRRAEDRGKEYECKDTIKMTVENESSIKVCQGTMKFRAIQRTHWKYEKYDGS